MENPQPSVKNIALNYGALWGLGSIVIGVLTYVTNTYMERPWWSTVLGVAIMIGAIVMGYKAFLKQNGGYMSLGEALKTGMGVTLIASLIGAVWMYLFITVVEPGFVDQVVENAQVQMLERQPDMPQEQMDAAMEMTRNFTQPWIMVTISIVGTLFMGFITSLITGLIMKRNNPMA
ncbi:DUF4199 domain-containing protein [Gilvibacter sp.]|uniref:DUF4199 domain-containing protein n=1 Tax=Gilvibacter sp. TaxID=2729997 RepID=UPI003F4A0A00